MKIHIGKHEFKKRKLIAVVMVILFAALTLGGAVYAVTTDLGGIGTLLTGGGIRAAAVPPDGRFLQPARVHLRGEIPEEIAHARPERRVADKLARLVKSYGFSFLHSTYNFQLQTSNFKLSTYNLQPYPAHFLSAPLRDSR